MYKLKNSLIILFLIMLINGSCKNISKKDLSLTAKEYQKLGMPDPNKSWSIKDCIDAHITLSNLRTYDPLSLPRKHSKKSGAVFSRIVNKENLSFANDTTIPLSVKAILIQDFQGHQKGLSRLYTDNLKTEQYYDEELIDLYIFGLFVYEKMLELAGKIMNSQEQADLNMQPGLKAVIYNYLNMINMILAEQVKSRVYRTKDLDRLSMEVLRSLIKNREWIEPVDRQKITIQIQNVIEKSPSNHIKNNYRKTLKVLNNTNN
jgi:hypothetical protein